jgi:hypothetical protein
MGDNAVYCQQRKLRMQYYVPITRYTPISPYTNTKLTPYDLDMRRKAEILKHTGPQKSTQASKLTKAQLFAQVVRGFSPTQKLLNKRTGVYNPTSSEFCDSSLNLVLTSSSDVPGPIMALYLDSAVPLYQYAPPNEMYSENLKDVVFGFRFYPNPVLSIFSPLQQSIGALEIFNGIPNSVTNFTLTIPYTLTNSGDTINSNSIKLFVTYAGSPVLKDSYDYSTTTATSTTGIITISNIVLYTATGYIFEFALTSSNSFTVDPDTITITEV